MKMFFSKKFLKNSYIHHILPKNELYGVLAGTKPIALKDIDKNNIYGDSLSLHIDLIGDFLKKFGISYTIITKYSSFCGNQGHRILVYSKDKDLLQEVEKNFSHAKFRVGYFLGYPECCINSHSSLSPQDRILGSKDFFYLLNDIPAYESIQQEYISNKDRTSIVKHHEYFYGGFLTWSPCSYHCVESLKKLKRLEKFIEKFDPDFYKFTLERTKKRVIFIDKANWVSFDKEIQDDPTKLDFFEGVFMNEIYEKEFSIENKFSITGKMFNIYTSDLKLVQSYELGKTLFYLDFTKYDI